MKKWSLRFFRRQLPGPTTPPPEFGVRLTLTKGDKVVSRDARGGIHISMVSEHDGSLANVVRPEHGEGRVSASGGGRRRGGGGRTSNPDPGH